MGKRKQVNTTKNGVHKPQGNVTSMLDLPLQLKLKLKLRLEMTEQNNLYNFLPSMYNRSLSSSSSSSSIERNCSRPLLQPVQLLPDRSRSNSVLNYIFNHIPNGSSSYRSKRGFSLFKLFSLELNLPGAERNYYGNESDGTRDNDCPLLKRKITDDESYQELINMMSIPWFLEKFMIFGLLVCFNSFLSLFTLAPLKIIIVFVSVLVQTLNSRNKFSSVQKLRLIKRDVITMTLIAASLAVLSARKLDISKMYHDVRGQADIKLYVMFGVLEVAEKLCSSIGQDLLNILFHTSSMDHFSRFLVFYFISIFYLSFHAYILIYQTVSLNVAANSYSNALLTLLLSNQFSELKSSVFKKMDREGLFQITMADLSERFQLSLMLVIIAIRNFLQLQAESNAGGGFGTNTGTFTTTTTTITTTVDSWKVWSSCVVAILKPSVVVIGSEIFVDWLKHSFISKFNKIKPKVYRNFLYVSCLDFLQVFQFDSKNIGLGRKQSGRHEITDYIVLTRRIGLPLLASVVCFLRMTLGDFRQLFVFRSSEHDQANAGYGNDVGGIVRAKWRAALGTIALVTITMTTLLFIRMLLVLAIFKIANQSVAKHRLLQDMIKKKMGDRYQEKEMQGKQNQKQEQNQKQKHNEENKENDEIENSCGAETPAHSLSPTLEINSPLSKKGAELSSPIHLSFLPGTPNTEPSTINPSTRAHLYDADESIPPTPEERRNEALNKGPLNETQWSNDDGDEGLSKVLRYKMSSKRIW